MRGIHNTLNLYKLKSLGAVEHEGDTRNDPTSSTAIVRHPERAQESLTVDAVVDGRLNTLIHWVGLLVLVRDPSDIASGQNQNFGSLTTDIC